MSFNFGQKLKILFFLFVLFPLLPIKEIHSASELGGVGMTLDKSPQNPQEVMVFSVIPGSPAERGMIKKGDRLIKVDGVEIKGLDLSKIAEKIVGPVGSSVTLTIFSEGVPREIVLQRVSFASLQAFSFPSGPGNTLSLAEQKMVKEKIVQLTTNEQRIKMKELLQAFKDKKITKEQFLQSVNKEF